MRLLPGLFTVVPYCTQQLLLQMRLLFQKLMLLGRAAGISQRVCRKGHGGGVTLIGYPRRTGFPTSSRHKPEGLREGQGRAGQQGRW